MKTRYPQTAIRRNLYLVFLTAFVLAASGCNNVRESKPIAQTTKAPPRIFISSALPEDKYLPGRSARIPNSNYLLVQTQGGNALLGPLIGAALIQSKSNAAAKASAGAYVAVSPSEIAESTLPSSLIAENSTTASYVLKPFVFVQKCYDENFRLSLVFHLEGIGAQSDWVGRYLYHIPGPIPVANFGSPSTASVEAFEARLRSGAEILTGILNKDINGALGSSGQKIHLGSMHLVGEKIGGLGIYTMPEEMYFKDVDLIEETADYVVVRMKGNMQATGIFGGMVFGTHYFQKSLIHKLEKI